MALHYNVSWKVCNTNGAFSFVNVLSTRTGVTAAEETVSLQPAADLAHLRYVSVLLWGPSS